jgi:hypothetical protein
MLIGGVVIGERGDPGDKIPLLEKVTTEVTGTLD